MRYCLCLSYDGSSFCGWQIQPNAPSVQATLEATLSRLLNRPVAVTGAGRTDTGVHAFHYVAHFQLDGNLPFDFRAAVVLRFRDDDILDEEAGACGVAVAVPAKEEDAAVVIKKAGQSEVAPLELTEDAESGKINEVADASQTSEDARANNSKR